MSFHLKDDGFPLRDEDEKVVAVFHVGRIVGSNLQALRQLSVEVGLGRQVAYLDEDIVSQAIAIGFGVSMVNTCRCRGQIERNVAEVERSNRRHVGWLRSKEVSNRKGKLDEGSIKRRRSA